MINMENIKLDMYNGIKEGVGGNYGFFSVGFDFGYNQSKNRIDELLDEIEMLKFQLKAADSVNEGLSNLIKDVYDKTDNVKIFLLIEERLESNDLMNIILPNHPK